ncbi:GTP 3',8-cyclase MoaA [Nanchangia anserum]|uniref:GTP 3',8-cyclase n=1 Tax=Nanchangia anserum TaxID=2692125 RepID=A0A8I0GA72_9ACTO|nr:GTP 3',8-cyclase MoaA [Nanchangia anserum]MBD3689053.1 GTP 3',8-cyclase MoaA [Nanchangia anserum]QOX81295.1 GTP 3',8-cyclase MoaA [Nanchangia anserum]
MDALVDQSGRTARDLRISVTDRCNLRCAYCLPEDARSWAARSDLLRADDVARLVSIGLEVGIHDVRFTGGEPLLRPDLADLIAAAAAEFDRAGLPRRIALTTNAIGLDSRLDDLLAAGLGRINISLDTLDPDRFAALSRRRRLADVMAGLDAVAASSLGPVKVNTVIVDSTSLAEIPSLVDYCLARGWQWRAIELMPFGPLAETPGPTGDEILSALSAHVDLSPRAGDDPHAPARTYDVPGGTVGIIASMSSPFCHSCSRTRVSATGRVYPCLFSPLHVDVSEALRAGRDDEVKRLWREATWNKPAGHPWLPTPGRAYSLSAIGG